MKGKLKKSLAFLLVITLSLSLSNIYSVSAEHIHKYTIPGWLTYSYTDYDSNTHTVHEHKRFACTCGDFIVNCVTYLASHIYTTGYSYTGYNYHSGTRHYFEFAKYCDLCRHKDAYFDPKTCSGPPCTIPY